MCPSHIAPSHFFLKKSPESVFSTPKYYDLLKTQKILPTNLTFVFKVSPELSSFYSPGWKKPTHKAWQKDFFKPFYQFATYILSLLYNNVQKNVADHIHGIYSDQLQVLLKISVGVFRDPWVIIFQKKTDK